MPKTDLQVPRLDLLLAVADAATDFLGHCHFVDGNLRAHVDKGKHLERMLAALDAAPPVSVEDVAKHLASSFGVGYDNCSDAGRGRWDEEARAAIRALGAKE